MTNDHLRYEVQQMRGVPISPDECERLAEDGETLWWHAQAGLRRAAATIRYLREELDAAYNKLAASEQTRKHLETTIDATGAAVIDLREQLAACEKREQWQAKGGDDLQADRDTWRRRADELGGIAVSAQSRASICERQAADAYDKVNGLRSELAAAKLTAEISAGMLETLQAETADLIEVERCRKSINAAGWDVAPFRKRIEDAGFRLDLHFGGALYPVIVTAATPGICGEQGLGEPGGYPTLELLETAAQWSEARATPASCPRCGKLRRDHA